MSQGCRSSHISLNGHLQFPGFRLYPVLFPCCPGIHANPSPIPVVGLVRRHRGSDTSLDGRLQFPELRFCPSGLYVYPSLIQVARCGLGGRVQFPGFKSAVPRWPGLHVCPSLIQVDPRGVGECLHVPVFRFWRGHFVLATRDRRCIRFWLPCLYLPQRTVSEIAEGKTYLLKAVAINASLSL